MKQYLPTAKLAVQVLIILLIDRKLGVSDKIAARLPG